MANEKDSIDQLADGAIEEVIAFTQSPMKWAAMMVFKSYRKFAYFTATVLPMTLTVGGPTSISNQQPLRKPDEHVPSQSQSRNVVQEGSPFEVSATTTSTGPFSRGLWQKFER